MLTGGSPGLILSIILTFFIPVYCFTAFEVISRYSLIFALVAIPALFEEMAETISTYFMFLIFFEISNIIGMELCPPQVIKLNDLDLRPFFHQYMEYKNLQSLRE